jgi:hypothetical protein
VAVNSRLEVVSRVRGLQVKDTSPVPGGCVRGVAGYGLESTFVKPAGMHFVRTTPGQVRTSAHQRRDRQSPARSQREG